MESYILENHIAFFIKMEDNLEYVLGVPKKKEVHPLVITIKEKDTLSDFNKLNEFSKSTHSIFLIPVLTYEVIESLKKEDTSIYREVFYQIAQSIKNSTSILTKMDRTYEKPYFITTFLPSFTRFLEKEFQMLESMETLKNTTVDSQKTLETIPKKSEEVLLNQRRKEELLALRGQLLRENKKEDSTNNTKGKSKVLATKAGKIYKGVEPDGFIDIFLLCMITLVVTLGTSLAVIFTLS